MQSTLAVLLDRGFDGRRLRFEHIVSLVAAKPAARFRIAGKGSLSVGNDGDLLLLDPAETYVLDAARLQQRHKMSPYVGVTFGGIVRRTIRRGETIFADGKIVATGTPNELRAEIGPDATLDEVFTRIAGSETEMGGSYGDVARMRRTARRLG